MVSVTDRGLYCAAGDFYIDPTRGVPRAIITHAHSDHARPGSASYLTAAEGVGVLRQRLGRNPSITGIPYGQKIHFHGVTVSFHPAGHVLGSAQVRLERGGEIWVISGDYKIEPDPTCTPFEPVPCHTFITESTFALPIYQWAPSAEIFAEIGEWCQRNQARNRMSLLLGYSLGKAPRLLASLPSGCGPLLVHPSVETFLPHYPAAGVRFPSYQRATRAAMRAARGSGVLIAPPQFVGSEDFQECGDTEIGMASGWMLPRGKLRRSSGFAVSDHADWPGLISAIRATGAGQVWATHGYTAPLVRWLRENGYAAEEIAPVKRRAAPPTDLDETAREDRERPS